MELPLVLENTGRNAEERFRIDIAKEAQRDADLKVCEAREREVAREIMSKTKIAFDFGEGGWMEMDKKADLSELDRSKLFIWMSYTDYKEFEAKYGEV